MVVRLDEERMILENVHEQRSLSIHYDIDSFAFKS